ncbi:hypothetical protein QMK19_03725 [Streptomyces sp. H10-C2]|uniref:hypothetical protein n=1 Tax=unclassified Streptomyces TaxID=2593676 RepID=UPI0024BB78C4|nr:MULTISPECIES: hypothetical protein [unclassified Streptomyces]MDJ0342297.1 hypothetical protein [Streptomyces sp. PH10-H1]MDJ0368811.1 hypothetical protein [Streptomyces sp. H10-C2]
MNQFTSLSTGKKLAIGAAVLAGAPFVIAGAISGAKDNLAHHSAASPTATVSSAPETTKAVTPLPSTASPAPSTPGPAQMLADLDGDTHPVADYQRALDSLAPKCTQDKPHIAAIAHATLGDLRKNGVDDETELSVLQHLNASAPGGGTMDCTSVAAAYAVLRESQ